MTKSPPYYQRCVRRRLTRLAFYWFAGGVAGVLMYLVIGIYASLFV